MGMIEKDVECNKGGEVGRRCQRQEEMKMNKQLGCGWKVEEQDKYWNQIRPCKRW
jgi:hypothetical protein